MVSPIFFFFLFEKKMAAISSWGITFDCCLFYHSYLVVTNIICRSLRGETKKKSSKVS